MNIKILFFIFFISYDDINFYANAFEAGHDLKSECVDISKNYGHNQFNMHFIQATDFYFFKLKSDACNLTDDNDVIISPVFSFTPYNCDSVEVTDEPPHEREMFSDPFQKEHIILRFDRRSNLSLTDLSFHFISDTISNGTFSSLKFKRHGVTGNLESDKYVYSFNNNAEIFCGLSINGICLQLCYNASLSKPDDDKIEEECYNASFNKSDADKIEQEIPLNEPPFGEDQTTEFSDNNVTFLFDGKYDVTNETAVENFKIGRKLQLILPVFLGLFFLFLLVALFIFYKMSKRRGIYIL
nr:MAG: hypothetical protein [Porcellio scaber clopovirus]